MLWVKLGTHIIDHPRFLGLSSQARDLWLWGMLYSGSHELDGHLPMVAVMSSPWGSGGRANVKTAADLVDAGLWVRDDRGYTIARWTEQGNATKAQLQDARIAAKERMKRARKPSTTEPPPTLTPVSCSPDVLANFERTSPFVPTSTSNSLSGYGSQEADRDPVAGCSTGKPPGWWDGACDAAAMTLGGHVDDRGARWAEYEAARHRKGWAMGHQDAVGWLAACLRGERTRARERPAKDIQQSPVNRAWKAPEGF